MGGENIDLRESFVEELIEIAKSKKNMVVLDPDVGSATRTWNFGKAYPDRFYELGIAEQNTFGVAAGLATTGLTVVAATFAVFASMRAAEMIRTSICYPKLNVKVIGGYAGLTNGKDGATHQSVEDIAIMRSFPNQTVLVPSDGIMARKMAQAVVEYQGPVYVRLEYGNTQTVYDDDFQFEIGKGYVVKEGTDVTLISYGIALIRTLEVANQLAGEGIKVEVIDMPTLKPFDKAALLASIEKTGAVVTVEEHSIIGGLASAVSDMLVQAHLCPYFKGLGIPDVYTESGTSSKLRDKYGIGKNAIYNAVHEVVSMKEEGDRR